MKRRERVIVAGSLSGPTSVRHLAVLLICLMEELLPLTADRETEDSPMFVRKVSALLKPKCISKFDRLMHDEIIPLLRNQNGFQDELTFFNPSEDAVTSTPTLDTYETLNSTFCNLATAVTAAA